MKNLLLILFVAMLAPAGFGQSFNYKISEDSTLFTDVFLHPDGSLKSKAEVLTTGSNENVVSYEIREYYEQSQLPKIDSSCSKERTEDSNNYWETRLFAITSYQCGVKHGIEIAYWKSNEVTNCYKKYGDFAVKHSGQWYKGQKIGFWEYFDKSGQLEKKEVYKNGILKKSLFFKNGKKVK